jgi:tetratricopeptide (TPR) repeat protein
LGHTVFTTNFDDLLLQAIFALEHTARVFGDLNSKDIPVLKPDYPQIVHLHGRHTSYYLLNTSDELSKFSIEMQDGFKKHINDSDLIVLGYSGWDDLVMNTLRSWPNNHNLIQGNLIWIPYRSINTILPETRKFLDACPTGRVQIIVNKESESDEEKGLDADSFMIAMCNALTPKEKGFKWYRSLIMETAEKQHGFLLNQLEKYPEYDPNTVLVTLADAKSSLKEGAIVDARKKVAYAKNVVDVDDLPEALQAESFLKIGILEMLLSDFDEAEKHLEKALAIWDRIKASYPNGRFEKAKSLQALGQLNFQRGDLDKARNYVNMAHTRFTQPERNSDKATAKTFENTLEHGHNTKLAADIAIRSGNLRMGLDFLSQAKNIFEKNNSTYGVAICCRALGDAQRLFSQPDLAENSLSEASKLFLELPDKMSYAYSQKSLGDLKLQQSKFDEAHKYYLEASSIFVEKGHPLGEANVENALGDFCFQQKNYEIAAAHYEKSSSIYKKISAQHGYLNSLTDLAKCYKRLGNTVKFEETITKISNHKDFQLNNYAGNIIRELSNTSKVSQNE